MDKVWVGQPEAGHVCGMCLTLIESRAIGYVEEQIFWHVDCFTLWTIDPFVDGTELPFTHLAATEVDRWPAAPRRPRIVHRAVGNGCDLCGQAHECPEDVVVDLGPSVRNCFRFWHVACALAKVDGKLIR